MSSWKGSSQGTDSKCPLLYVANRARRDHTSNESSPQAFSTIFVFLQAMYWGGTEMSARGLLDLGNDFVLFTKLQELFEQQQGGSFLLQWGDTRNMETWEHGNTLKALFAPLPPERIPPNHPVCHHCRAVLPSVLSTVQHCKQVIWDVRGSTHLHSL